MSFLERRGIEKYHRKRAVKKKNFLRRDANDDELNRHEAKESTDNGLSPRNVSSTIKSIASTPADPELNWSEIKGKANHGLSLMSVSSTTKSIGSTPADPSTYRISSMSSSSIALIADIAEPEMASSSKEQNISTPKPSYIGYPACKSRDDQHSGMPGLQCGNCGKNFSQHRNYIYHFEDCKPISCQWCSKTVSDYDKLKDHMTYEHGLIIYQCRFCRHTADVLTGPEPHVYSNCPMEGLLECDSCGDCLPSTLSFQQHLHRHQDDSMLQCCYCDFASNSSYRMNEHLARHNSGEEEMSCCLCAWTTSCFSRLVQHIRDYHPGK